MGWGGLHRPGKSPAVSSMVILYSDSLTTLCLTHSAWVVGPVKPDTSSSTSSSQADLIRRRSPVRPQTMTCAGRD